MSFALVYWIIMLVWFVFGLWASLPLGPNSPRVIGGHVAIIVLFVLLGWRVFGPPVHQ